MMMEQKAMVTLVNYTPSPERSIALAARMCYSSLGASQLNAELGEEDVKQLVERILDLGHESVLEMASFSFAIEGISRVTSHQLVRHRIGSSYAQKSQRYLAERDFDFIIPEGIASATAGREVFLETMAYCQKAYDRLLSLGIHQEEARYLLPGAVETKIFVTMNARSLRHFFHLRCCNRAQKEIRNLAHLMLKAVQEVAPLLFKKAGPPCISQGTCPEGDLSCGGWKGEVG